MYKLIKTGIKKKYHQKSKLIIRKIVKNYYLSSNQIKNKSFLTSMSLKCSQNGYLNIRHILFQFDEDTWGFCYESVLNYVLRVPTCLTCLCILFACVPLFFTCLTCLYFSKCFQFLMYLACLHPFYTMWNNPEPTATSKNKQERVLCFSKSWYIQLQISITKAATVTCSKNSVQNSLIQLLEKHLWMNYVLGGWSFAFSEILIRIQYGTY